MAIISSLTEAQCQEILHTLYIGDTSTPAATDTEYLRRRILLNAAIDRWQHNKGYLWDELWARSTDSTVATPTSSYPVPDDFRFPGGYVFLMDGTKQHARYNVVAPEDAQTRPAGVIGGALKNTAYFIGSPAEGYTLNFVYEPATQEDGKTIQYDYYKYATKFTGPSTVSECPDPYFLIYYALSELYRRTRVDLFTAALNDAEERLRQMEVRQMQSPHYQETRTPRIGAGIWGE